MAYSESMQTLHFVPLLAPVDTAAATATSDVIDAGDCQHVQFVIMFGSLDVAGVIDVYEADNNTPTTSVATAKFSYRQSADVGTDLMGAVTAGSLALATAAADAASCYIIDIDPAHLTAGYPYVYVTWNPTLGAANLIAIFALVTPRYSQDVVPSIVD